MLDDFVFGVEDLIHGRPLEGRAATIKARWICEHAHQQLKEELGLDHFEGRSWQGPPPPCADDSARLRLPTAPPPQNSEAGKKNQWTAASTKLAVRPPRHRRAHRSTAIETMPALSSKSGIGIEKRRE